MKMRAKRLNSVPAGALRALDPEATPAGRRGLRCVDMARPGGLQPPTPGGSGFAFRFEPRIRTARDRSRRPPSSSPWSVAALEDDDAARFWVPPLHASLIRPRLAALRAGLLSCHLTGSKRRGYFPRGWAEGASNLLIAARPPRVMKDDVKGSSQDAPPGQGEDIDRSLLAAELLTGPDLKKTLGRLVHGDPLGIGPRTLEQLELQGYLLDPERVMARVFGRVAHDADLYDENEEEFDDWFLERVDRSIAELLRQDQEEELRGQPTEPNDIRYQFLTELLGLEAGLCRRASIAINDLDEPTRKAFIAVAMRGRTLESCIESGMGSLEELRLRIRTATRAISRIVDDGEGEERAP